MTEDETYPKILSSLERIINSLENKILRVENETESIKQDLINNQIYPAKNTHNPIFYSILSQVQNDRVPREDLDKKLTKTAELTILDYKKNPPKRRWNIASR
jgi:predicted double-glycine peptidase